MGRSLPTLAQITEPPEDNKVVTHTAQMVQQAASQLQVPVDDLQVESEFHQCVDITGGPVEVFLIRFTGMDPPFAVAEKQGGGFVELAEARSLPQVELELLRSAYEYIMTG